MRLFAFALAGISALVTIPRPAAACSLATNDLWSQNAAHASDVTAPSLPAIGAVEVTRHFEDEQNGCGRNVSSCGSFGTMEIEISATDERAQEQDIGYEVRIVGGDAPAGFDPTREGRVRPFGRLIFFFDVESPDFSVDLEIRAVDGNGNVGDPIVVTVTDERPESSAGCTTGKHGGLLGFGAIALATALAMRRRRR